MDEETLAKRRIATLLAEGRVRRHLDDPERLRRRLAVTVRAGTSLPDEQVTAEVDRLFNAVRPDPQTQALMAAIKRRLGRR